MRRLAMVLACVGLGAGMAAQQTPTFKSGVTLVAVDVTVLDHDGKPVPDLKAGDFGVTLDGRVQPVKAMTLVQASAPAADALANAHAVTLADARPGRETFANNSTPAESRLFVILIDDLSFTAQRGKAMFAAAQRFVDSLPASDLIGFTLSSGAAGTVNPTTDHAAIDAALKKAVGVFIDPRTTVTTDPIVGLTEALDIDHGDSMTLQQVIKRDCGVDTSGQNSQVAAAVSNNPCVDRVSAAARRTAAETKVRTAQEIQALLDVLKAMRAATGIKHLVVLSDGLALGQDQVNITPIASEAAQDGVEMSIVAEEPDLTMDIGPPVDSGQGPVPILQVVQRVDGPAMLAGLETVADMSGGNFFHVIGSADPFFARVKAAAGAVYRLGIEPPAGSTPGADYLVAVTVNRPGVSVHANHRAVATSAAAAPALSADEALRAAIGSGQPQYGVPIRVATALRRTPSLQQIDLGVTVELTSTASGPMTLMFSLVDPSGQSKSGKKVIPASPDGTFIATFAMPVDPGEYHLRFAAADGAGAIGSLVAPVTVKLPAAGTFNVSDLLTSWSGSDGTPQFFALDELPAAAKTLNATLEIYPPAGAATPDDAHVTFALYKDGSDSPVAEHDASADEGNDMLHAAADFDLDDVPAGSYVLRAKIFVGDKQVGSASTRITKK